MDLANFETTATGVDLVFWEAKTFSNPELENGDIVGQLGDYQKVIDLHKTEFDDSYRWVAEESGRDGGMEQRTPQCGCGDQRRCEGGKDQREQRQCRAARV